MNMTPTTAVSTSTLSTEFSFSPGLKGGYFRHPRPSIDLPSLLDHQIETVTDLAPLSLTLNTTDTLDEISIVEAVEAVATTRTVATTEAVAKTRAVLTTEAAATTAGTGGDTNSADHCSNRDSVARSHLSSDGSLTLASSSETLAAKTCNVAGPVVPAPIIISPPPPPTTTTTATKTAKMTTTVTSRSVSMAAQRQRYLEERDARKASLRPGTQALIAERAESLQRQQTQPVVQHKEYTQYVAHQEYQNKIQKSPTFMSRPSIDRLRTITKKDTGTKPPVSSLISF
ncbi:MAG: hypothetical protein J3Q66DRAFT_70658 [Benniella sp.]|nr:MAG: hypothetical protein J3Q66DRAFT_70658 [Benniella sp.]